MIIRKATIKDLKSVQELNLLLFEKEISDYNDKTLDDNWTFSETGTKYYENKIIDDDSFVVVAEEDGKIIGYLAGGICENHAYRKPEKMAELENTLVLEQYRGKGIGGKLMDAFADWCNLQKIERIRVSASAPNKKGIVFYKKNGFKEYDIILERKLN